MDPLLLEVLRFGTAILAGGLVAVIAQRLAFSHARRLEAQRSETEQAGRRRALLAEIRENIVSIGPLDGTQAPGRIERTAWSSARGLPFADPVFEKVAHAYAVGTDLNSRVDMVERNLTAAGGAIDWTTNTGQQADAHQKALVDQSVRTAKQARDAFLAAREAIEK